MSGYFGSTVEDRMRQEINVIANKAEADLEPLRKRYLESLSNQDRTRCCYTAWNEFGRRHEEGCTATARPTAPAPSYYLRRMQVVLHDAGNKMAAVEQHWLRRPR